MLLIVPPSEAKRPPPADAPPVDLKALSFPSLTPLRERILDAAIATSEEPDALRRFHVGPTVAEEVARNGALRELPTSPVLDVYAGPFHEGLAAESWSPAARDRAGRSLVIVSALWGALRPVDRIPAYRLHVCSRLIGMDGLEPTWRTVLPDVLASAAGPEAIVIDLRTPTHQAMGKPSGMGDRTVTVRVTDAGGDGRSIGDVVSKRTRGEIARHLLEARTTASHPEEVAAELAARWSVDLRPPTAPGVAWTLAVVAT